MTEYNKELALLNEKQREAASTVEGPLLVIAGPGTGKTQLLSMRVANILKNTDTMPGNVLCLTFTNKAALNMRERIIRIAGIEASQVNVKTFHSFAAEVMNSYPDDFWSGARLSVAPDSTQLEIIQSILSELPFDNPLALRFAGQFTLVKDVQEAINLAKDAGLTPQKLRAIIDVNLAYIDAIEDELLDAVSQRLSYKKLEELKSAVDSLIDQEIDSAVFPLTSLSFVIKDSLRCAVEADEQSQRVTNTSTWKKRWVQTVNKERGMHKERKRNLWWKEISTVYEAYRREIHSRGYYDYSDMIVEVIQTLESNPYLLSEVQERFSYVMIDEFQDTNPAQLRLAHLVANHHSSEGKPNIMVVGDDDQSIFKFNGAQQNNMLGFRRQYKDCKTIVLKENYRSSQAVLDTARKVIEQATDRLSDSDKSITKDLHSVGSTKSGIIDATTYPSQESQYSAVARTIASSYSPKQTIALLARKHDSLVKIAGILHKLNVPIHYEQQSNILEHPIVNQIYLLSKLVVAIQAGNKNDVNSLIHKIIRHPLWGIRPESLWLQAQRNLSHPDWMESLQKSKDKNLRRLGSWFMWLGQITSSQPLAVSIEYFLGLRRTKEYESPLRNYFLSSKDHVSEYFYGLSAIQLLRSLVNEFSKSGQPTVDTLVMFYELNISNNKIIADESPFVSGENAVSLMTVHKAKGLEFDTVYILDAVDTNWQPRIGGKKPPANLPLQRAGETPDDYARLMYVAITRARSDVHVSSFRFDHSGKEVMISPLISGAFKPRANDQDTSHEAIIEVLEENLNWPRLSTGSEKHILKARLENYSLNVTHLLNFLNIEKGGPQYFKERNLLNLPEAKQAHLSYGTAIHASLENAQKQTNSNKFSLGDSLEVFERVLSEEQLTRSEFTRYIKRGKLTLERLFDRFEYTLPVGSKSEQSLQDVLVDGARIGGKLDRIDITNNELTIVDYKTGNVLTNLSSKSKAHEAKIWNNKLQLAFYSLLAQHYPRYSKFSKFHGVLVYLESESKRTLIHKHTPDEKELSQLKRLISVVFEKIIKLDLPNTTKYSQDFSGTKQFAEDLINGRI